MAKHLHKGIRITVLAVLTIALYVTSHACVAAGKPVVHFAGLVYLGDYRSVESNYPNTLALNAKGELDKALLERISKLDSKYFTLKPGLANLRDGESLIMAVGIEREFLSREIHRIGGAPMQKLIADLSMQILVIDFKNMTLQAAYPQSFAANHVVAAAQTIGPNEAIEQFWSIYLNPATGNALDQIARAMMEIDPYSSPRYRLGVTRVSMLETAKTALPAGRSVEQVENFVGQVLSAELASQLRLQVVPYSRDYAIAGQMSARFANGSVYNLKLPKADYEFDVVLNKFDKLTEPSLLTYGAYLHLQMREEFRKTVYIDDDFRFGVPKLPGETVDDWPAYEDALQSLLANLSSQLKKPERGWFNKHARNTTRTYEQFNEKKGIFQHENP